MINKKIGIITFHFVNNFGGALQAYALRKTIEDKCNTICVTIDYRNAFVCFTDTIRLLPITLNIKEIYAGLKTLRLRIERLKKFKRFVRENCNLTRQYRTYMSLKTEIPKCDKYVCGSDQIWNPFITMGVSPSYFLAFVRERNDKIAYAPSFGTDGIANFHKKQIKKFLTNFGCLSVREKSGQKLIFEVTGRTAAQLIDPTFLLKKEEWSEIAVAPQIREKYILIYMMQRDKEIYKYARKIKAEKRLKIIEISRYGYKLDFIDEVLINVGPAEFLGFFLAAEYVCTNSYHGLVYSIIFKKDFYLIPCKRFSARIDNLLQLLHIQIENDKNKRKPFMALYDKKFVESVIDNERKRAYQYLENCING